MSAVRSKIVAVLVGVLFAVHVRLGHNEPAFAVSRSLSQIASGESP